MKPFKLFLLFFMCFSLSQPAFAWSKHAKTCDSIESISEIVPLLTHSVDSEMLRELPQVREVLEAYEYIYFSILKGVESKSLHHVTNRIRKCDHESASQFLKLEFIEKDVDPDLYTATISQLDGEQPTGQKVGDRIIKFTFWGGLTAGISTSYVPPVAIVILVGTGIVTGVATLSTYGPGWIRRAVFHSSRGRVRKAKEQAKLMAEETLANLIGSQIPADLN